MPPLKSNSSDRSNRPPALRVLLIDDDLEERSLTREAVQGDDAAIFRVKIPPLFASTRTVS